ncbi:MAG: hypothetical protein Q8L34_02855 [Candidatus Woesearchaeota archaeon]|nr:hypothetical protein [Candidatus Woesearchaeota archaeon]
MRKVFIKSISNKDDYNELDTEKSEVFLENLQKFVISIRLAKVTKGEYEVDGQSYDIKTYYTLFYEDRTDDWKLKRLHINDFKDGHVIRYFNKKIEMLIIFLADRIKLIFYCDKNTRKKVISALLEFCKFQG